MIYEESIQRCLDVATVYGVDSQEYLQAAEDMRIIGRRAMKKMSKTDKVINFLYKMQWLLKRKKY